MASESTAEFAADDVEDVRQLQKVLHAATELMANEVSYEDVAIFIGTTKSGKSTLINYLLGNNLVGVKGSRILPTSIQKADNSAGPQIGRGHSSETIIPTRWENPGRLPGLTIWDAPGFDDNRGKVQDITNAFYVYELFKNIKSVKIVLVADIQHIMREPINPFLSLLKSVENLLQARMTDCFSSIVVIFTKVDEIIEIDENLLSEILQPIWTNSSLNMSPASRDFIRYLTEHTENVGFFKQAREGPVTENIEVGVIQAIQRATSVPENVLKDVLFPSIVDSSKVFLYKCRDKISSVTEFNELQKVVCEALQEILQNYSQIQTTTESRDQLHTALEELNSLQSQMDQVLNSNCGFSEKINILEIINPKIESAVRSRQLVEKSKLMEFIDSLLDLQESKHFDFNLQSILVTAKAKVEEIIISLKLKLNQISKIEADCKVEDLKAQCEREIVQLRTQLQEIKSHNQKQGAAIRSKSKFKGFFSFLGEAIDGFLSFF